MDYFEDNTLFILIIQAFQAASVWPQGIPGHFSERRQSSVGHSGPNLFILNGEIDYPF